MLVAAAVWLAADGALAADPIGTVPGAGSVGFSDCVSKSPGKCDATLKLKPDQQKFGEVVATLASSPLVVTATNTSKSASITFSSIVAAPPFAIQNDGCSGAPLAAGQSCEVALVFHPTAVGKVKNKKGLTFTDSAKKNPQHVALEGDGVAGPTPTASPTPTATPTPTITASPTPTITATAPTPTVTSTPTRTATGTCTPLPTPYAAGLVLIAGGQASDGTPLNTAEVFNPKTNTFTLTTAPALGGSNMTDARYQHAAAAVSTVTGTVDKVIVTGGIDASGATNSTETFTSNTNSFSAGLTMVDSRQGHTATFLVMPIGEVLVTGGQDTSDTVLKSADIFDFVPSLSHGAPTMNTPRVNAAASAEQFYQHPACNPSEQALITGGSDGTSALQTAEVFDSLSGTFTLTDQLGGSQMNAPRVFHTATLLGGGILIAGGEGATGVAQSSAEVFDIATNIFTLTTGLGGTDMTVARAKHTATAGAGVVLITGGIDSSGNALASAEVFNPSTNTFTAVGSMHSARFDHAAAELPNGTVLITGGEDGSGNTLNTAEIFNPATNTFTLTTDASLGGNNMNVARKLHTASTY